jgi:DNA-binding NtrC family response regulator
LLREETYQDKIQRRFQVNVLIVEDDVSAAESIAEIVRRRSFHSETAASGKEATERIEGNKFALVLLDIFLPDCRGDELIPQFKERCPGICIVAMTGYNDRKLEMEVREQGINYYMIKPFTLMEMTAILDHISKGKAKEVNSNGRSRRDYGSGDQSYC